MTRALDGTYWRAHTCYRKKCKDKLCYLGEDEDAGEADWKPAEYATRAAAENAWDESWRDDHKFSVVGPIRPRMSIVKAVALLTEARKQGVELWMRRVDAAPWFIVSPMGIYLLAKYANGVQLSIPDLKGRWIVATPSDARKIDAKRGGK